MTSPDSIEHAENWHGGFYELAINLGVWDDARLEEALNAIWQAGSVTGCLARGENGLQHAAPLSLESLERHGHLAGVTMLPSGGRIVCGVVAVREDEGEDWLDFYLPLGALADCDRRVGAFPFGIDGGAESRSWREPLDTWLSDLGASVFQRVPFLFAAIGFEASGLTLAELTGTDRYFTVLRASGDDLEHLPVTHWDFGTPG